MFWFPDIESARALDDDPGGVDVVPIRKQAGI
jgi:hypothetical protein